MSGKIDSVMKKNLVSQYLLQGAKYILPLIILVYLARVLGSDAYGFRSYVLSVMSMVQIVAEFGFENSGTEDIVKSGKDSKKQTFIASSVFFSRIVLLIILAGIMVGIVALIPLLQRDVPFVAVSYLTVVFNTLIPDFIFMGREDMGILTNRYLITKVLYIVLLLLFVRSDADLMMVAFADMATSAIAFVWSYVAAWKRYSIGISLVSMSSIWSALKKSAYYFISRAATTLYTSFTTVIIGIAIPDTTQIAWWSLSMTIIGAAQSLFTPINNVLYPRVIATHDLSLIKRFSLIGGPVSLVMTLGVFFLSPLILEIAGGPDYGGGAGVLSALSLLIVVGFYGVLFGWPSLGAFGRIKQLTTSTTVAALFHVISLVVLWQAGLLTIMTVCYLRDCTEVVMTSLRWFNLRKLESDLDKGLAN